MTRYEGRLVRVVQLYCGLIVSISLASCSLARGTAQLDRTPGVATALSVNPTSFSEPLTPSSSLGAPATPMHTSASQSTPSSVLKLELRCPSNPEVPLDDLSLDSSIRLVVADQVETGPEAWRLVGRNSGPQAIPNVMSGDHTYTQWPIISPNGHWLAYFKYRANNRDLWITSAIGDEQLNVLPDISLTSEVQVLWANEQTMYVSQYEGDQETGHWQVMRIQPLSGEHQVLQGAQVPGGVRVEYAFSPDGLRLIQKDLERPSPWQLFDYLTGSTHAILPSLGSTSVPASQGIYLQWTPFGISLAYLDEHVLTYVVNLSVEEAESTESVAQVATNVNPGQTSEIVWWSTDGTEIAFKGWTGNLESATSTFQLLDIPHNTIFSYCVVPSLAYPSPDGRFMAWDTYDPQTLARWVTILDTTTGQYAKLSDWYMLGWASI
jgi:hypothetical protein